MSFTNTAESYGSVAKWLHWTTALLFLGAYVSVYYRHWFTVADTPSNWSALQFHLSFGISIAVILLLRIFWKFSNRSPDPEPGSKIEHLAAKLGHFALYIMMIIMVTTGFLGTGVNTEFFFMFDIQSFKNSPLFADTFGAHMNFDEFEEPLDFIHKEIMGSLLVWLMILGHAAAALYHHFVKKDRTLVRMTTGQ